MPHGTPASGVVGHVSLAAAHVSPPVRCWCRQAGDTVSSAGRPRWSCRSRHPAVWTARPKSSRSPLSKGLRRLGLAYSLWSRQAQLSKLSAVNEGCMSLKAGPSRGRSSKLQDMSSCVSSKDGSADATWGYTPYKVPSSRGSRASPTLCRCVERPACGVAACPGPCET